LPVVVLIDLPPRLRQVTGHGQINLNINGRAGECNIQNNNKFTEHAQLTRDTMAEQSSSSSATDESSKTLPSQQQLLPTTTNTPSAPVVTHSGDDPHTALTKW
jgi:hypothetical protein